MEIDIINEGTDSSRGTATWISCGLKIKEAQLMLALEARNIDLGATENQRLSIIRRRDHLQSQVNGFMEAAEKFLGHELDIGF